MTNYKNVSNFPHERELCFYTHAYYANLLDEDMINYMSTKFSKNVVSSKIITDKGKSEYDSERTSDQYFINYSQANDYEKSIFHRINYGIDICNENFFNYDLNGYDAIQYTEYHSSKMAQYNFHMDLIFGNYSNELALRKLSFTILLNDDFEGGKFQINTNREHRAFDVEIRKGTMITFPSFLLHRVTPVTKGIRKSLVGWVRGPKFR